MAELTAEQFEEVPDILKGDFELSGDVYVHRDSIKLKDIKGKFDDFDKKYKATASELAQFKESQAAAIEQARKEALEQAITKGDVKAVEKRYQEEREDLERRMKAEVESERRRVEELTGTIKADKRKLILGEIAEKLDINPKGRRLFENDIGRRVDFDISTGKPIILNEDGSASSIGLDALIQELDKDEAYDSLRKPKVNTGGMANGSNSGGGASEDFSKMNPTQRLTEARKRKS